MSKYKKLPLLKDYIAENPEASGIEVFLKNEKTGRYRRLQLVKLKDTAGGGYKIFNNAPPYRRGFFGHYYKSLDKMVSDFEIRTEGNKYVK